MLSPVVLGTSAGRERDSRARVPKPTAPRRTAASEAPSHGHGRTGRGCLAAAGRQKRPAGRSRAGIRGRLGGRWWWRTGTAGRRRQRQERSRRVSGRKEASSFSFFLQSVTVIVGLGRSGQGDSSWVANSVAPACALAGRAYDVVFSLGRALCLFCEPTQPLCLLGSPTNNFVFLIG